MIEILVITHTVLVLLIIFFVEATHKHEPGTLKLEAAWLLASLCSVLFIFSTIATLGSMYNWNAAKYQVNIINREYGTNFTQAELYYASDVIEALKQQNTNRSLIKLKVK